MRKYYTGSVNESKAGVETYCLSDAYKSCDLHNSGYSPQYYCTGCKFFEMVELGEEGSNINSFTTEEIMAMDAVAKEMRDKGHNGTADYYSGGWRCYNACRACEEEAGTLCECGATWFEGHAHDCPKDPDNQPENCPRADKFNFGCGPCKHNNTGCGRQEMFPESIVKKMDWDSWSAVKSFSEDSHSWTCFSRQSQQGGWELWVSTLHPTRFIKTYSHSSEVEAFDISNTSVFGIDVVKVRRRIEDALRKNGDITKLLITAALYNVNVKV